MGRIKHGHTRNSIVSPTYKSWEKMLERCRNSNHVLYRRYGGRGIIVSERWHNFANFLADMGIRPSLAHSIDRINNDGNYEPGNCRWATRLEQARSRLRIKPEEIPAILDAVAKGPRGTKMRLAIKYNVSPTTISDLLRRVRESISLSGEDGGIG